MSRHDAEWVRWLIGILVIAFAASGCGGHSSAPVSLGRVHSPRQIATVFAAHGFVLYKLSWTLPQSSAIDVIGLAGSDGDSLIFPDNSDPHHLQLALTIWWSAPTAALYASPKYRAASRAHFLHGLNPALKKALTPTPADNRYEGITVSDNVVAEYIDSPYTAKIVARLKTAMKALARAPTVKPPCSGKACTQSP